MNQSKAFKISIQLGDGTIHQLTVPLNADFKLVCENFCSDNNLDRKCEAVLQEEIKKYHLFLKSNSFEKKLSLFENDSLNDGDNKFSFHPIIDANSNKIINKKRQNYDKCVYRRLLNQVCLCS